MVRRDVAVVVKSSQIHISPLVSYSRCISLKTFTIMFYGAPLLQLRPGCIKIHPHFTMWLIATPGPDSAPWNLQPFHFFTYLAFWEKLHENRSCAPTRYEKILNAFNKTSSWNMEIGNMRKQRIIPPIPPPQVSTTKLQRVTHVALWHVIVIQISPPTVTPATLTHIWHQYKYRGGLNYHSQVARIFQSSWGRSGKHQQINQTTS